MMKKNIILDVIIIISFIFFVRCENNITDDNKLYNSNIGKSNEIKNINESFSEIQIKSNSNNETNNNKNELDEKILNKEEKKELDDDIDINLIDYAEHIIIVNTHEDQLVESIFYFLSFVLIIYIILFLYKFYKCYCENTLKEFGEDNGMKNPQNDPELQRISTTDDENIIDNNKNIKDDE